MIGIFLAIVVIVGVGAAYLAYRNRPENTIESGIRSFRREMRALAPPPDEPQWSGPGSEAPPQPTDDDRWPTDEGEG